MCRIISRLRNFECVVTDFSGLTDIHVYNHLLAGTRAKKLELTLGTAAGSLFVFFAKERWKCVEGKFVIGELKYVVECLAWRLRLPRKCRGGASPEVRTNHRCSEF